jgi:phage terminase small subunit
MNPKLTDKQAAFVAEYLVDMNSSAAARRAGYASRNANVTGPRLLADARISAAVRAAMAEREHRTRISADRVLAEIARIAFADVRAMFDADGLPRPIGELDGDTAAAVAGLEVSVTHGEDGSITRIAKVKIADKLAALEKLGRHLGLFDPKRGPGSAENPIALLIKHAQGTFLPTVADPPEDDDDDDRAIAA